MAQRGPSGFQPLRLAICLFVAAFAVFCLPAGLAAQAPVSTVIEGGTLIDGTGAAPLSDAVIVLQGKRIAAVGASGTVAIPAGASRIDARGRYIIPGLIDAHVHMYDDWTGELFLVHGITTVVDQGGNIPWIMTQKDGVARDKIRGPRIYTSGITFRCTGSACHGESYQPDRLREQIRSLAKAGADFVAVGQYEPPDVLRVIADEAHKHGLPVSGEAFYVREASAFGLDAVVHTYGISMGAVPDADRAKLIEREEWGMEPWTYLVPPASDDLRQRLLVGKVHLIPMLIKDMKAVHDRQAEFREETARLLNTPELDYIPLTDYWFSLLALGDKAVAPLSGGKIQIGVGGPASETYKRAQEGYRNVQKFIREYVAGGGRVLAGTDIPNYNLPGISLHEELRLEVDAGLTPMQALQASTLWPAEYLHKDADVGTIRPGRYADIVVLDANPLDDIGNTKRIHMVLKEGVAQELRYHREYRNPIPAPPQPSAPTATEVVPPLVAEQSGDFDLTVKGRDFVPDSAVRIAGLRVPTRFVNSTVLIAHVAAESVKDVGTLPVTVYNPPGPRSGVSNAVYLIVKFK